MVQDMYDDSETVEVTARSVRGSAVSYFLFAVVMNRLTDEVRQRCLTALWSVVEKMEAYLRMWRYARQSRNHTKQQTLKKSVQVENNAKADWLQKDSSKSKKAGLLNGSET